MNEKQILQKKRAGEFLPVSFATQTDKNRLEIIMENTQQ